MNKQVHKTTGASAIVLILILVLLLCSAGGGFIAWKRIQKKNLPPIATFEHIALKEDVVTFTFKIIPPLYHRLVWLNMELTLIDQELTRLDNLESDFPDQNKVVKAERTLWKRLNKDILATTELVEKQTDSFYVSYMVNHQKGKALIEDKLEALTQQVDNTLEVVRSETGRLKINRKKSFKDKIRDIFS